MLDPWFQGFVSKTSAPWDQASGRRSAFWRHAFTLEILGTINHVLIPLRLPSVALSLDCSIRMVIGSEDHIIVQTTDNLLSQRRSCLKWQVPSTTLSTANGSWLFSVFGTAHLHWGSSFEQKPTGQQTLLECRRVGDFVLFEFWPHKQSSWPQTNNGRCWGPSASEGPQKQDLTVFLEYNV
jgi:hypothetical protein